jgi:hypothetical protein
MDNITNRDDDSKAQSLHKMIHMNEAIERHLSSLLDQASLDGSVSSTDDEALNLLLHQLKSSKSYQDLIEDLASTDNPIPKILKKTTQKSTSFSLFDLMAGGGTNNQGLNLPANIRDVLQCTNSVELLETCRESLVQDLILGFNTTQGEVQALADKLYVGLQEEVQSSNKCTTGKQGKQDTMPILGLHTNWIKECVKDEETISFAFLLVRNVILISSTSTSTSIHININIENENGAVSINEITAMSIVPALKEMMQNLMEAWNDTGAFQQSWLEIMHLWIRCSFALQHKYGSIHSAWALVDAEGVLFNNCFNCISSAIKIRMLLLKTGLVEYLMDVLTKPPLGDTDKSLGLKDHRGKEGLIMCHAISLLKTVVMNSSVWIFPYPNLNASVNVDADVGGVRAIPMLDTLKDEFHWIQNIDEEMKVLSAENDKVPTEEDIQYLLAPYCSLLEIALDQEATGMDDEDSASANLGKEQLVNPYLIHTCEQCITHILCSSARDQDLFTNGAMLSFVNIMKHRRLSSFDRSSLPSAVVACYSIIAKVTEYGLWENDNWAKWVGAFISVELPDIIGLLSKLKSSGSFDSCRLVGGILCPILKHHDAFSDELPLPAIRMILCDYARAILRANTGKQDDLLPLIQMVSSSNQGRSILKSMQSPSTLDAFS